MTPFIPQLIGDAVGSTLLLSLAIMLSAFLFEDATTVIVGVLVADGLVALPVALFSLYAGILAGDIVLYSLGVLARTHPRLAQYIDHDFTAPLRVWLESRYALTIFSGHFVPGLRFTTYAASGFFRAPLPTFILMAVVGGLVWASVLFCLSYWFGNFSNAWVGPLRWSIAVVFILALFLIARRNLLLYQATKTLVRTDADTRAR